MQAISEWSGAEAVFRAPLSVGGHSAAKSATGPSRIIERAEPCFITNASSYTHEQAHIINAIRGDSYKQRTDKSEVVSKFSSLL
jgi:hypothetical protein